MFIDELKKLPGVGSRSAERIAFHLLKSDRSEAYALSAAVRDIKEKIRPCSHCYTLADAELCTICADPRRDQSQIVVVEQPKDLITLELAGLITGVFDGDWHTAVDKLLVGLALVTGRDALTKLEN